jgi:hypothetical protein
MPMCGMVNALQIGVLEKQAQCKCASNSPFCADSELRPFPAVPQASLFFR